MTLFGGHVYLLLVERGYDPMQADRIACRYSRIYGGPNSCRHGYGFNLTCPHGCHVGDPAKKYVKKPRRKEVLDLFQI